MFIFLNKFALENKVKFIRAYRESNLFIIAPLVIPFFVNERTGIIKRLEALDNSFLPIELSVYSSILSIQPQTQPFNLNPLSIGGAERSSESAISKCLGEAIERYCAYYASYWKNIIYASYNEIKGNAIEPEKFALFSDSQYEQPNFYFSPFTKETKIYWVKGKNLVTGKDRVRRCNKGVKGRK